MAGAPKGRERRSQADPMGPKPVGVWGRGPGGRPSSTYVKAKDDKSFSIVELL